MGLFNVKLFESDMPDVNGAIICQDKAFNFKGKKKVKYKEGGCYFL